MISFETSSLSIKINVEFSLDTITKVYSVRCALGGFPWPDFHCPRRLAHSEISFHSFITFFVPLYFFLSDDVVKLVALVCALLSAFIVLLWGFVTVIVRSNVA